MSQEFSPFESNASSVPTSILAEHVVDYARPVARLSGFDVLSEISSRNNSIQIRREQVECLDALQALRQSGGDRALVQMATGLGKTTVVAADAHRYLRENPDGRLLFLCHQNDILEQARESFQHVLGAEVSTGMFLGDRKDFDPVTCLFASFGSMRNWRKAFHRDEFDYIVVDEGHHAKAPTYEPTLKYFKPRFLLGVTATPDRHDRQDIREIFGEEVFALSLEEAIAQGLTSDVNYRVIVDDIADRQKIRDQLGRRFKYSQLDRAIFIPKRDQEIARIIHERSTLGDASHRVLSIG